MSESRGKTLLLVEDEAILALTQKKQLEKYGYTVRTVNSGIRAVEAVTTSHDIDLVLMDINLGPGMDGTEAAETILQDRDIPIVFVSSHTEPEIVEKTEKITSYGYVVKNSTITVLDASIKMAFKLFDAKKAAAEKERVIFEHKERYRLLHENSGVGIGYYAPDGTVLSYNNLAASHMGGVPEDFSGKSIFDLFPPADAERYYARIQHASMAGAADVYEDRVTLPEGDMYFLSTFTRICDSDNKLSGVQIISQDITDIKIMEHELRESNHKSEQLLNMAAEIILCLDENGTITHLNDSGHAILGYRAPELIGKNWFDTCLPAYNRDAIKIYYKQLLGTDRESMMIYENQVVTGTGECRTIQWRNAIIKDSTGKSVLSFSSGVDVTDRHRTEQALRDSEMQKKAILNGLSSNVALLDRDLTVIWANRAAAESVAVPAEALTGKHCYSFWGNADAVCDNCPSLQALQTGMSTSSVMTTRDGKVWDIRGEPIFDDGRQVVAVVEIARDITSQKSQEAALAQSSWRLNGILEGTNAGTWEWNVQTGETTFNQTWAQMIGYSLEELSPVSIQTWMHYTHPEDLKRSAELLERHFRGEQPRYESECRMKHKDGHWVWVLDRGKVITWTPDGKPLMMFGTHSDITARREAEEKIQQLLSEKELILKEVHHRVKNNMNAVSSLLSLQSQRSAEPAASVVLMDARSKIKSMSLLYDRLYRSQDYSSMSLHDYLATLADDVVASHPCGSTISLHKNIQTDVLDIQRLQILGIILNELLTNSLKYAFTGRRNGTVEIVTGTHNGRVHLSVRDDGVGIPDSISLDNSPGFGLELVSTLAGQLNATIDLDRSRGTKITLEFAV